MGGEVRYCTTGDGVRIAYSVEGAGPPLLWMPLIFTSFSLVHELPWYNGFLERISGGRTLIRFDQRGTGLSQRDVTDATQSTLADDGAAVLDALGLERVSLLGGGPNGAGAIWLAATRPNRVAALVSVGAGVVAHSASQQLLDSLSDIAPGQWEAVARTLAGFNIRRTPEEAALLTSIYVRSTSGDFAAGHMTQNNQLDFVERLGDITARTLVIHSEEDALFPFSGAQQMAAQLPNARLLPLDGNYSLTTLGDKMEMVTDAINAFLDEDLETRRFAPQPAAAIPMSGLRTVLFTDLVGHSEMMSRLGDDAGRAVLREHERITREVLKAHGGVEVKTMGDGFMASFGSVTKAVECAVELQKAFAQHTDIAPEPLSVRVGLNAGEPIEEDGDLFGATVILASRIAAKADGGEILASDVVRGLCSGKGFLFADRGEFAAKGFEEPVRVYEVGWQV